MSNTSKWLMGCGIGCGVVILLIILVITGGYFLVKNNIQHFKEIEESAEILEEKYGRAKDFCPDANGAIKPGRLEVFLSVRDSMVWIRKEMEQSIEKITADIQRVDNKEKPFWSVLGIIRKGFGAIPQIAKYYTNRNEALIDTGMGLGEYYYIYVLAYYCWLEKSPGDGPDFQLMGGDNRRYRYRWHSGDWEEDNNENKRDHNVEDVKEQRRYRAIRSIRRIFLPMLRCQLEELNKGSSTGYRKSWRKTLETEIEALKENHERLPWQDELPDVIAASLEPYRGRLEAGYSEMLNPVELGQQFR